MKQSNAIGVEDQETKAENRKSGDRDSVNIIPRNSPEFSDQQEDDGLDWEEVERVLQNPGDNQFQEFLRPLKGRKVWSYVDKRKGMTFLHYAALKGTGSKMQLLLDWAKDEHVSEKELATWLNRQTLKDYFTALHFASFKGNLRGAQLLVKEGADIHMKNAYGLTMLHVAAQGDAAPTLVPSASLLVLLQGAGPGHRQQGLPGVLAAALGVLLEVGGGAELPAGLEAAPQRAGRRGPHAAPPGRAGRGGGRDHARRPLPADRGGQARRARQERAPAHRPGPVGGHAPDLPALADHHARKLPQLQSAGKSIECFMLTPPVRLTYKSSKTMVFFIFLFALVYAMHFFIVFPRLEYPYLLLNVASTLVTVFAYTMCSAKSPGYLKKTQVDFLELLHTYEPTNLCPDCMCIRTARSRHCSICHQCVERFDHHCPWINNCVGVNNHPYFLLYVIFQFLTLLICFVEVLICLIYANNYNKIYELQKLAIKGDALYAVGALCLIISLTFLLPVGLLSFVQTRNFMLGLTTNERFGKGARNNTNDNLSVSQTYNNELSQRTANQGIVANSLSLAKRHKEQQSSKSSKISKSGNKGKAEYIKEDLVANQNTPRNTFAEGAKGKRSRPGCLGNCFKMCCETKMKSQEQIYRDTKAYQERQIEKKLVNFQSIISV